MVVENMCDHIMVSSFRKNIPGYTQEITYCVDCLKTLNEKLLSNGQVLVKPVYSARDITSYAQPGVG